MKICYIQVCSEDVGTETRISYKLIEQFKSRGIEVLVNTCEPDCDFILCINGLTQSKRFLEQAKKYPHIKTVMYVWDCYPWTSFSKDYGDVNDYTELWVPSEEVKLRLIEFYDIDPNKCRIIKCYAELPEQVTAQRNDGFVWHFSRPYPDPNFGITNFACDQLGIPLRRTEHNMSYDNYLSHVIGCSFIITEYREASTGGLTLIEGYYQGKNVLVPYSIYMGAKDYFGDRAYYFKDGNVKDLMDKISMLWKKADDKVDLLDRKLYCSQYTIDSMVDRILTRLIELKHG